MKLRIRGNSVRIRVTRNEVAKLAAGERIEQQTEFSATSRLVSTLEPSAHAPGVIATFDGTRLALIVPSDQVRQWAASDQVGIQAEQSTGAGQWLRLLIEKDFECLHSQAEGDTDAFPNPRNSETKQTRDEHAL